MFSVLLLAIFLVSSRTGKSQIIPVFVDSVKTHAAIHFEASFFDFGTVVRGKSIVKIYQFVNTGTDSLRIKEVKVTCGCTIPTYPKIPIAPGSTGAVTITFNTTGKSGRQLKVIRVVANTDPEETILQMSGEIKGKKKKP